MATKYDTHKGQFTPKVALTFCVIPPHACMVHVTYRASILATILQAYRHKASNSVALYSKHEHQVMCACPVNRTCSIVRKVLQVCLNPPDGYWPPVPLHIMPQGTSCMHWPQPQAHHSTAKLLYSLHISVCLFWKDINFLHNLPIQPDTKMVQRKIFCLLKVCY